MASGLQAPSPPRTADWLVSAWDQVGAIYATSPASAVIEEVAADGLKGVLGLPAECSCAMVTTGCQMAPQIRVLTGSHRELFHRS